MGLINRFRLFFLAFGAGLWTLSEVNAQSNQFLVDAPAGGLSVSPPAHARNIEMVGVNLALLESLHVNDEFTIAIYGNDMTAIIDEVSHQAEGYTLRGHFDLAIESFFAITVVDDAVAGSFWVSGWESIIRLRYGGPNAPHYVHKVLIGPNDECAGSVQAEINPFGKPGTPHSRRDDRLDEVEVGGGVSPILGGCGPLDPTFDVMLIYTNVARAAAGGTSAIRAECINAVAVTEFTYLSCSIIIRTNIVSLAEVNYSESGTYENHLDRLTNPSDGILDGIHATRDAVDADLVSMILADDESGGLGWCDVDESSAMSVCRWDLIVDNFTLAHEIGHNIGCGHDPVTGDNCGWDLGWANFFFVPSEGMWRHTVMSYRQNGSTRIPYYSSPVCEYEGVTTGTTTRDNLAVILSRQYTVEAFRRTRMDVWVDFGYNGGENGSNTQPYNTVTEGVNRTLPNPVADIPILHIKPGSRNEAITISKPMIIDACGGTVTIGR